MPEGVLAGTLVLLRCLVDEVHVLDGSREGVLIDEVEAEADIRALLWARHALALCLDALSRGPLGNTIELQLREPRVRAAEDGACAVPRSVLEECLYVELVDALSLLEPDGDQAAVYKLLGSLELLAAEAVEQLQLLLRPC